MLDKLPTTAPSINEIEALGIKLPPQLPGSSYGGIDFGRIVDGKPVGTIFRFAGPTRLSSITTYDDQGRKHGPRIVYSLRLIQHIEYDRDQVVTDRRFSWGKTVVCEVNFREGKPHGPYFNRWEEGLFKNGKRVGSWSFYNNAGVLLEKTRYLAGRPHGYITYYWSTTGNKRCRLSVYKGVPHGWSSYWSPEGKLLGRRRFRRGKLVHSSGSEFPPAESLGHVRLKRETFFKDRGATTFLGLSLEDVFSLISSPHAHGLEDQMERENYYANPHPPNNAVYDITAADLG